MSDTVVDSTIVIDATNNHAKATRFRRLKLLFPNEADAEQGLKYLARFHLSHDVDFDDCVIGSTTLRLGMTVATINDRHFRLFKGLKVIRPY